MLERWRWIDSDAHQLGVYVGWASWLFGVQVDRSPSEVATTIHVGPVAFIYWRRVEAS